MAHFLHLLVEILNFFVFLLGQEVDVALLHFKLLDSCFQITSLCLQLLSKFDNLKMELTVFVHYLFILLLQWYLLLKNINHHSHLHIMSQNPSLTPLPPSASSSSGKPRSPWAYLSAACRREQCFQKLYYPIRTDLLLTQGLVVFESGQFFAECVVPLFCIHIQIQITL